VDEVLRDMVERLRMARARKVLEFVIAAAVAGPEALDDACLELVCLTLCPPYHSRLA